MGVQENSGRVLGFTKITTAIFVVWGLVIVVGAGAVFYYLSSSRNSETNQNQLPQSAQSSQENVVCARYTSIEVALANIDKACTLDLSGKDLTDLPDELAQLKNVNELHLGNNSFTEIPPEIFQLTQLVSLNLSDNALTTIPQEISQLSNLQSLDVSYNELESIEDGIELIQLTKFNTEGNPGLSDSEISKIPVYEFAPGEGLSQEEYEEAVRTKGESLKQKQ